MSLLKEMYSVGRETPCIRSYASVFSVMKSNGEPLEAQRLLKAMIARKWFSFGGNKGRRHPLPCAVCFMQAMWTTAETAQRAHKGDRQKHKNSALWMLEQAAVVLSEARHFENNKGAILPLLSATLCTLQSCQGEEGGGGGGGGGAAVHLLKELERLQSKMGLLKEFEEKEFEAGDSEAGDSGKEQLALMVIRALSSRGAVDVHGNAVGIFAYLDSKGRVPTADMFRAASSAFHVEAGGAVDLAAAKDMFESMVVEVGAKELWMEGKGVKGFVDLHELNVPLALGAVQYALEAAQLDPDIVDVTIVTGTARPDGAGVANAVHAMLLAAGCEKDQDWTVKREKNQGRIEIVGKVSVRMCLNKLKELRERDEGSAFLAK